MQEEEQQTTATQQQPPPLWPGWPAVWAQLRQQLLRHALALVCSLALMRALGMWPSQQAQTQTQTQAAMFDEL